MHAAGGNHGMSILSRLPIEQIGEHPVSPCVNEGARWGVAHAGLWPSRDKFDFWGGCVGCGIVCGWPSRDKLEM